MAGRHSAPREPSSRSPAPFLGVGIAIVLVVAILAAFLTGHPHRHRTDTLKTPSPPASTSQSPSVSQSPTPTPAATTAPPSPKPTPTLALRITGASSYVGVQLPNRRVLLQRILGHGQTAVFYQPVLAVLVGNAGNVRAVIHGHVHSPVGRPGQVLAFTVSPGSR